MHAGGGCIPLASAFTMALKRNVLPPRPKHHEPTVPPKPMKVIALAKNQRGLRINCDGCYVVISRDSEGTVVLVSNTSANYPLEVTLCDDSSVRVEARK